jgi:hypothetical protein
MNKIRIIFGALLTILAGINIYVYHLLLIKASAIGDTKAGLGDPVQALIIENKAQRYMLWASLLLGISIGILIKIPILFRILLSIFIAFLALVLLNFLSFSI